MKTAYLATTAFAAAFLSAASAFAFPVGSATFSPGATSPVFNTSANTLASLTSINFSGAPLSTSSNSPTNPGGSPNVFFFPASNPDTITAGLLTIGGTSFTFSDTASLDVIGSFTATTPVSVLNSVTSGNFASETLTVNGILSGGSAEATISPITTSLTFALTQTGGPGTSISLSGTIFTPQVAPVSTVPEPASLALLGAGLFGIGFVRRRFR